MGPHHYGAFKVGAWMFGSTLALAALVHAVEPTVKVALIVAASGLLSTLISTGTLLYLGRKGKGMLTEIRMDVNSNFTKMREERNAQTVKVDESAAQLAAATSKLSHAEGRREGFEAGQETKKGE